LNLPGLPEGSAYQPEPIMDAVARGVPVRAPELGIAYVGFVDMSGGSSDDAVLAIAHRDADGRAVLDTVIDQGQRPPFDPNKAVQRFMRVLRDYRVSRVTGDRYGGLTSSSQFTTQGITYEVAEHTTSELYEALEPRLNEPGRVVLLDVPTLEQQFLGLVWKAARSRTSPASMTTSPPPPLASWNRCSAVCPSIRSSSKRASAWARRRSRRSPTRRWRRWVCDTAARITMTMIEGLPPTAEQIVRAKKLRRASVLIATHAQPGPTRTDVLDRLALLIADLEGMPARECQSCGTPFGLGRDELKFYRARALALPTHCRRRRAGRQQQRRAERESSVRG
jgi:hypothetical protein